MRLHFSILSIAMAAAFHVQPVAAQYSWNNLPVVQEPVFRKDTFNILRYGAKADGLSLNSAAINKAITAASQRGGGVVLVPAGLWLTGPVVLKSNVELHLAKSALLQFTKDFDQYPLIETYYEGLAAVRCQAPVSAVDAENIAITGSGIIDGGGDAWRQVKKDKLTESQWKKLAASGGLVSADNRTWYPSEKSRKGTEVKLAGVIQPGKTTKDYEDIKDFLRPNMVVLTRCKKVLLEGVTFQNSPAWCLHPLLCEHITLRGVYVKNPWYAQNGDGVDLESCRFGRVEDCVFDVGDDAICIKSGRDEQGRKRGVPTENFIIKNNLVYHAHGGFVIGSEMSGGARNLFVSNCTFMGTDIGLRFKTTRGRGGVVEKIFIKDINMTDIPGEAILFDMYYMAKDPVLLAGEKAGEVKVETFPVTEATPQFRDFHISNVVCHGAARGIFIRGLPEMPINNINIDNVVIKAKKGVELLEASNIRITNATFEVADANPLVTVRNSREIQLDKIKFTEAKNFITLQGGNAGVVVTGTDVKKAKEKPVLADGTKPGALIIK